MTKDRNWKFDIYAWMKEWFQFIAVYCCMCIYILNRSTGRLLFETDLLLRTVVIVLKLLTQESGRSHPFIYEIFYHLNL